MASDTEAYSPVCISDAVDPSDGREDAASGPESLPIDQECAPREQAAVAAEDGADAASLVSDESMDDRQRQSQRAAEGREDSPAASSPPPPAADSCDAPSVATAAVDQHGSGSLASQQQQQPAMTATGYAPAGMQYPPFFANPFMTPYLPQATMGVVAQQPVDSAQQSAAPDQAFGEANFRMNPFTGGYYLAPSQYQEMMQQYLQSLLHAASFAPDPSMVSQSPASESGRMVYDDTSNGLAEMKLAQGTRPVPAQLPPYFQQMMPQMNYNAVPFPASTVGADEKRSGASSVEPAVSSCSSASSSVPAVDDQGRLVFAARCNFSKIYTIHISRASVSKSESSSTVSHLHEPTSGANAPNQPFSFVSPATTIASSRGESALTSLNSELI